MRFVSRIVTITALSSLSPVPALADVYVLSNDSVEDGDEVAFQQGFVTGEAAAATLGEVSDSFTVRKVQFLFGPAGPPLIVTVSVYADTGGATPGALLYSGDYEITPADDALHEIDLTTQNVEHIGPGNIRVSLGLKHDGAPGVARDDDGCTAEKNWIGLAPAGWTESCAKGVTGDWVIRAEIDGPPQGVGGGGAGGNGEGGSGEGGSPPIMVSGGGGAGGGSNEGGANAGGSGSDGASDDGCGCRVVELPRPSSAAMGILGALALLWRRKRRVVSAPSTSASR